MNYIFIDYGLDALMIRFISCFLLVISFNLQASTPVSGSFQATQTCPAYVSKNSKSNPDDFTIKPNEIYPIREINKPSPNWIRIEIPLSHYPLRWVSTQCGMADYEEKNSDHCDTHKGKADANILALSSQPGFCQHYGYEAGKPECLHLAKNSYQATHLTLHGLWPNQNSCGQHYGYCDTKPKPSHCSYNALNLSTEVSNSLDKLMPSYHYGSCLERHEWNKHGSCQNLSDNGYFSLATRLTTEVNNSAFGQYLTAHNGQTIALVTLRQRIAEAFGANNSTKIRLGCKNGLLVDVFITLPAIIPEDASLESLINQGPSYQNNDSCPGYVMLSDFHKEAF